MLLRSPKVKAHKKFLSSSRLRFSFFSSQTFIGSRTSQKWRLSFYIQLHSLLKFALAHVVKVFRFSLIYYVRSSVHSSTYITYNSMARPGPNLNKSENLVTHTKGQLISKWFFGVFDCLQKMNGRIQLYYYDTSGWLVFVCFLEEIDLY